jgi:hypothetical protein
MTREELLNLLFAAQEQTIKQHDSTITAELSALIADLIIKEY